MTSEELRAHSSKTFQDLKVGLEDKRDLDGTTLSVQVHQFQMLAEIAAQLADLNSYLKPSLTPKIVWEEPPANCSQKIGE